MLYVWVFTVCIKNKIIHVIFYLEHEVKTNKKIMDKSTKILKKQMGFIILNNVTLKRFQEDLAADINAQNWKFPHC